MYYCSTIIQELQANTTPTATNHHEDCISTTNSAVFQQHRTTGSNILPTTVTSLLSPHALDYTLFCTRNNRTSYRPRTISYLSDEEKQKEQQFRFEHLT